MDDAGDGVDLNVNKVNAVLPSQTMNEVETRAGHIDSALKAA